jgi:polysaccharide export outer membrane protein
MTSVIALLLLSMAAAAGQQPLAAAETPRLSPPASRTHAVPEYQLGPGDLLAIHVSGLREFDLSTRVSNSGRVRVPYVGVMIVAGMTTFEAEREIARLIKERELVNEPTVRVHVEQYRARPTYVLGEVAAPGQFVITGEMYLLDLVSKAGGLLPSAEATGFLYRSNPLQPAVQTKIIDPATALSAADGEEAAAPAAAAAAASSPKEVIEIDLQALREGTRPDLNVKLQGGDVFYVPRRRPENIYVIGEVRVPGSYTLPRGATVTAAQAIIYAGGPLPAASMGKSFLMRHDEQGVRQAIPVNFSAILNGKEPDFPVKADDIIFIPNSPVKTIGVGLLNMMPTILQQWLIF